MPVLNTSDSAVLAIDDANCFEGTPRRLMLSGPRTLYRFAGSKTTDGKWARSQERGAWWFDSDMLDALKDDILEAMHDGDNGQRRTILAGTRTDLAVLQRWSDMTWFCLLKLAPGYSLSVWVGAARYQPDYRGDFLKDVLPGGGTQYFIPGLDSVPGLDVEKHPTHKIIGMMARNPNWRG